MRTTIVPAPSAPARPAFKGAHYSWPFERRARPFVVRIVEPRDYAPGNHTDLFYAVMTELFELTGDPVDGFDADEPNQDRWDLITFPEAFVPSETLISALQMLASYGPSGCVHVGLRPSKADIHLFKISELKTLLDELSDQSPKREDDLSPFRTWLKSQTGTKLFNVGCLFVVDSDGDLRVCLHPKLVRSQFETNPLPERHMEEGQLLSLVTLCPSDPIYPTITLQPLLCSDALNLPTDRSTGGPLMAVNRYADSFGRVIPDHVDIISVATCTPQTKTRTSDAMVYRDWHGKFQETFLALAENSDYARHHFAVVVLANFQEIGKSAGGLSGIFLPVAPRYEAFPEGINVTCWGRPKSQDSGNNRWSLPGDDPLTAWQNRGFIASLTPSEIKDESARILGCTIHRLPRENSLWATNASLTKCEISVGQVNDAGKINFKRMSDNV